MGKKNSTSFGEENQPNKRRGKSAKTIIIETFIENSHLNLKKKATKEEAEKAFFNLVAKSAFDPQDKERGLCINLLANKGWANVKPSSEMVTFEFNEDAQPHEQAFQVIKAISEGQIPPDIGGMIIQSIRAMIDIEEYTDLKLRIESIEKSLGVSVE